MCLCEWIPRLLAARTRYRRRRKRSRTQQSLVLLPTCCIKKLGSCSASQSRSIRHIPAEGKLVEVDGFAFRSGGAPFFSLKSPRFVQFEFARLWNCCQRRSQRSLAVMVPFALTGKRCRSKYDRMWSYWRSLSQTRS